MRSVIGYGTLSTSLLMFLTLIETRTIQAITMQEESSFQSKVPVKLIWANEGDDVELPCDITPPTPDDSLSMVLWFRDSAGIPIYSLDARSGNQSAAYHWTNSDDLGRRTYFQVGDGQRAKLKITKVKYKDQGLYRCRVDFVDSPTRHFRTNLSLVEEPTKPVIYDAQGREVTYKIKDPFLEGYGLLLTCQVSGGKPRPSVTWWKDGELLDGVVDTPTIGFLKKFTRNDLFIPNVTRSLWGTKLECRAQSLPMKKPIIREVSLDVYLKPAVVKITLNETMYAGKPNLVKCETWGSSPAAEIIWKLGDNEINDANVSMTQRSNFTVSQIVLNLGNNDNEKILTCIAKNRRFPGGTLEETKTLNVYYAPVLTAELAQGYFLDRLREGDDLKLICNIQSNPLTEDVIWYHYDVRLQHNATAGILISSNTLTIRVLTFDHYGEYSCEAYNIAGKGRSQPTLIYMKYVPRCREGYQRNEIMAIKDKTVTIKCEIEANPFNVSFKFYWGFNRTQSDVLPLPNSEIRDNGLVSFLNYTPSADTDYGTFSCWARNEIGRQRQPCYFNVVPAKPPQTPMDCSLHNESTSLEVNCIPGSDGGSPQHFLLEVRGSFGSSGIVQVIPQTLQTPQSDQGAVSEVLPIYQEQNPNPIFRLHDLEPGYDYTLYVYAVNGHGKSKPALLKHVQVAEPIGGKLESTGIFLEDLKKAIPRVDSQSMIIVIVFIGIAALILVSIGIVIGLVICRRRSNRPVPSSPDDFTTPTYIPAQRIEPRIRYSTDGRHLQRRSLYVEENRNDSDILQQVEVNLQV